MNCHDFEACLERFLDGKLDGSEQQAVQEHLSRCGHCRELEEMVRGSVSLPETEAPADLTAAVLSRTSGSSCGRARELLCDLVDGDLPTVDSDLVRGHLQHCGDCESLAAALVQLAEDLPPLAEATPDAGFVNDVMAATLPMGRRLARRLRRMVQDSMQLWQRPRIAWEAAYVGAMVLALLFGTPVSPLKNVPGQALALAQVNPVQALADTSLARIPEKIGAWSQSAWQATGARVTTKVSDTTRSMWSEASKRMWRAGAVSQELFPHTKELGRALFRLDTQESYTALVKIGGDIRSIWKQLTTETNENKTRSQT